MLRWPDHVGDALHQASERVCKVGTSGFDKWPAAYSEAASIVSHPWPNFASNSYFIKAKVLIKPFLVF